MPDFKEHDVVLYKGRKATIIHIYKTSSSCVLEIPNGYDPDIVDVMMNKLEPVPTKKEGGKHASKKSKGKA